MAVKMRELWQSDVIRTWGGAPSQAAADPFQASATVVRAGAASASGRGTKTKQPKPTKPGPLAHADIMVLVQNLVYLGHPSFLKGPHAPKPLPTTGDSAVDNLLRQAADVVKLWNDRKTLPQAQQIWRPLKPRLLALLTEASSPALGYPPEYLKPASDAVLKITENLGKREGYFTLQDLEVEMETPDVSEASAMRELKKLEPSLKVWKDIIAQAGPMAANSKLKVLSHAIDVYNSTSDMSAKLAAFQKAGLLGKGKTHMDLKSFLAHGMVMSAAAVTHEGITIAEIYAKSFKEGKLAAEALTKRHLTIMKIVGGAVALYELAMGTKELIHGIQTGDWGKIIGGAGEISFGAIGLAEAVGVIESSAAGALTAGVVVILAEIEILRSVSDQLKWAKEYRALKAFKSMVADTVKLVPPGRRMAAATQLMLETESAVMDGEQGGKYDLYKAEAMKYAGLVNKALRALAADHVNRNDLDSVGGYPALVNALGQTARQLLNQADMGILLDDPMSMSETFKTLLIGVKAMATEGDKRYGAAG